MYDVEWHPEAGEDLQLVSRDVARQLVKIAQEALDDHYPPDGGKAEPYLWRRGITPGCRAMIDENAAAAAGSDTGDHAWDYVLYYKRSSRPGKKYEVLKIVHNSECFGAFTHHMIHC